MLTGSGNYRCDRQNPQQYYDELAAKHGDSYYSRIQAVANGPQKNVLKKLSPEMVSAQTLAGDAITARLTHALVMAQPLAASK